MSKKKIVYNFLTFFGLAVILCGAGFLLSSDAINAFCRAPSGCIGCHDLIGNTGAIIGAADGSCDRGNFDFTPDLSDARFIHRTFKMNDGRILLTGGAKALTNPYTVNSSVDIYDPVTNTITSAAPMNVKRLSHNGATLRDGRVLVLGGRTTNVGATPGAGILSSAEIYDPATNTWTYTGSMNAARRSAASVVLNDGRVLVTGGADRAGATAALPKSACEIYDPSTGTFTSIGNMTTPRTAHSATLLDDGKVLITGGSNGLGTAFPTNLAEIFNPADNSFTAVGPSNFPHLAQVAVKLRDGRVLIPGTYYNLTHTAEGGNISPECEIYDPATQTFSVTGSLAMKRIDIGGQPLLDGTVLIAGGVSTDFQKRYPAMFQTSAEVYDPATGTWSITGLMSDGRDEFSGIALDDGRVLISGGFTRLATGSTLLKTAELYTPGLVQQINGLTNVINDLPASALKKGNGHRNALLSQLNEIGGYINASDLNTALTYAKNYLHNMNGCGNSADSNDKITDCAQQKRVRAIVQVLVDTLTKMTAPNQMPTVTIDATPTSGTEPLTVNFTSTASDADGTIVTYYWQFGDGQFSAVANPLHKYSCDGTYTATLRVTDNSGGTAQATIQINVAAASNVLTYNCDVQPIFDKFCIGCHGAMGGLNLQSCAGLKAGSINGLVIVPGDSASSVLYDEISTAGMPPSGPGLSPAEVATIGAWIDSLDPNNPNFCN